LNALTRWLRLHHFTGGIVLPEQQRALRIGRIESLAPGRRLRIPIKCRAGDTTEAIVQPSQNIRAYDLIGQAADPPLGTHAPVAGTVTAVGRTPTADGHTRLAVEIAVAAEEKTLREEPRPAPERPSSPQEWAALCDRFGLLNNIDGRPLSDLFRRNSNRPIEHLVVRALGAEPVETASPAVLLEQGTTIIDTAETLANAIGAKRAWIAVSRHFDQGRNLLRRICRTSRVTPVALSPRYPQANASLLIQTITGLTVPVSDPPEEHGVCVVNTASLAALAEAVLYALPPISSVLTVTGDALARTGDYRIAAGTTAGEVLDRIGITRPTGLVVAGGPLSGRALPHPDVVMDSSTTCLTVLARRTARPHDALACFRCGWCVDACPVGLDPAALMNLTEQYAFDRAADLHPEACIECGICSYVCPAHLDLTRAVSDLKRLRPPETEDAA
jgi:electron transport complex protein RnfC